MTDEFDVTKHELEDIKRKHTDRDFANEQLQIENENFKKLRDNLKQENGHHLQRMEELNNEVI